MNESIAGKKAQDYLKKLLKIQIKNLMKQQKN